MKRIRKVVPLALAMVLVAVITAVASVSLTNEKANPNFVNLDDAAIPSSVNLTAEAEDPADGSKWALRTFHNKRGERCIDAGQLINGEFTRPTPTGNKEVLAGQGGSCGPSDMQNQIAVFGTDVPGANRHVVAALVEPNVTAVVVTTPDGKKTKLTPQGDEPAVVGVFANVRKTTATNGDEVLAEIKKRNSSTGPGPGLVLSLQFIDGSALVLFDRNPVDPAEGTMARDAYDALNSPTGK